MSRHATYECCYWEVAFDSLLSFMGKLGVSFGNDDALSAG
jgi:hypothetical protein